MGTVEMTALSNLERGVQLASHQQHDHQRVGRRLLKYWIRLVNADAVDQDRLVSYTWEFWYAL